MASMPHYMSKGVNEMAAKGIEAAVHALEATLLMLITAIQEIVIFVINLVTSTYVCLITLAVKGSVGVVVDATKEITGFIDDTMSDIFNGITREVKGIQDTLNKITDNLGKVPSFFGSDITIPKIEFGSLDKLKEIKIPQDFTKKLDALEESIPDFKTVQKAANDVIRIPFQKIHVKPTLTVLYSELFTYS
jgi:methyl-accepting chemotaxis protein